MSENSKFVLLKEMLDNAESHLRTARQLLEELSPNGTGNKNLKHKYEKTASALPDSGSPNEGEKVTEGIFDGQNMIGKDHQVYPVPANYASKSKLISGDALKLVIGPDGSFTYKQIGPIERKHITGTLIQEDGQYKVLTNSKSYKVLLASVTYFRAEVGDKVTLVVPAVEESEWGAIEHIIPHGEENFEELYLDKL